MRLKIEFIKESTRPEDEKSVAVEFHNTRAGVNLIERSMAIPEGMTEVINFGAGQMVVIKAPANPGAEIVYDPEQKAAVAADSLSPERRKELAGKPVYPSDTAPNLGPGPQANPGPSGPIGSDGKTIPNPVAQASLPHGGQDKQAGLEGNLANPQTIQTPGMKPSEDGVGGAAPSQGQQATDEQMDPKAGERKVAEDKARLQAEADARAQATQQQGGTSAQGGQTASGGRTISTTVPGKPAEKDKDSAGNPIPAVDQRGPTTHAPPPNDTKKA